LANSVKLKVFQRIVGLEQKPLETTHRIETLTKEDIHILMGLQKRRDQGTMDLESLLKKQGIADELWV
jgi:hypothetical protein